MLDIRLPRATPTWTARLDSRHMVFLKDHKVENHVIFPAAGFVDPLLSTGFPLTLLGVARLAEIVEKLNTEINASLADPKLQARLADLGGTVMVDSPADFGKFIAHDTEKWAKVIRAANIKPD